MSNDAINAAWNDLFNKVLHALDVKERITGILPPGNTAEVILNHIEDLKKQARRS